MNQVDVDWPFHTFLKPPAVKEGINVHLQPLSARTFNPLSHLGPDEPDDPHDRAQCLVIYPESCLSLS